MKSSTTSWLAILMGVIIGIVDIAWMYQSTYDPVWVAEGMVILIADVIWIYLDYSLMKSGK